ncbi:MAG: 3-methyl-2-oxobutanoate hydroxymethyltransferase [Candidatus Dormibacteraeota bacterium]|nr:3-methyl-2-oxobutanoate hydroxymethyltransferase [Candidatus Dormibacteraeota bacterium]
MTTVLDLQRFKAEGKRFAMLTAYDYTTAQLLDAAEIPVLLVGDSAGMVMLGHPTTLPITMDELVILARAVSRGASNALLVGDLPFLSYQASVEEALHNAGRLLKEAGMHAVKLEGGGPMAVKTTRRLTEAGIPVMGHLGLTPQSVHRMGGFKVQGKDPAVAARILAEALELEAAGAFAIVLEAIPSALAAKVTRALAIPTIGIGAGIQCDGQVLVVHDMLGLSRGRKPRFVKEFAHLGELVIEAARRYAGEVEAGTFPDAEHSYSGGLSVVGDGAAEGIGYGGR